MLIAGSLGLTISERTAHRIIAGQIAPVRSVAARLLRQRDRSATPSAVDLTRDRRGLKISRDDLSTFSRAVERDFSTLAERYYLNLSGTPRIRVTRDRITVTFDLGQEE